MASAGQDSWNGTLWAVSSPRQVTCFRVQLDAGGRVVRAALRDYAALEGRPDFDEQLRARLHERCGATVEITVARDGGAGFAQFQADLAARRCPTPPPRPTPASQSPPAPAPPADEPRQPGLWDKPF